MPFLIKTTVFPALFYVEWMFVCVPYICCRCTLCVMHSAGVHVISVERSLRFHAMRV
jgi:hypothetical protein